MRSDSATAALREIEHHIDLATQFVTGLTLESFQEDTRTVYAVVRCLEIISGCVSPLQPLRDVVAAELAASQWTRGPSSRGLWQNHSMKRPFSATVWREGDWFVSQCLDVDVASQGRTEEEALANLREALELHFEPPVATHPPTVRQIEVEVGAA